MIDTCNYDGVDVTIMKTIDEINQRIKDGDAVVVTAAEMTQIVRENGADKALSLTLIST